VENVSKNAKWIELVNSYGPFNHCPWEGRCVRVSHEEGLGGRAVFLARAIRKIIKTNFTDAELKKMTVADVGCYDGWILHQLSDLPFKKMVGIEPRKKNIIKGEGIRNLLGIKTRVKFRIGDIEKLVKEKFDIVLCIGTFHHLESIASAMKNLDAITKRMLIVDTICLPSKYLTESLAKDLELKDLIYQIKPKRYGLIGEKYESAYYDGSTSHTTIVNIPSIESLIMHFDILGYQPIKIAAGPKAFRQAMEKNKRPFEEVLIYGEKRGLSGQDVVASYAWKYEHGLVYNVINPTIIRALYSRYVQSKKSPVLSPAGRAIVRHIDSPNGDLALLRRHFKEPIDFEIVKNMRFNPRDKISFEYAKVLHAERKYQEAIAILHSITETLNADWRVVYRSFYLMHLIYEKVGDRKRSLYYAKLCKRCHANFPLL